MPLFRASHSWRSEQRIAIFEAKDADSLLEKIKNESDVPEGQEWVRFLYNSDVWMLHDPSLHESHEETADDEKTTYLSVAQVHLGEWWDPDMD